MFTAELKSAEVHELMFYTGEHVCESTHTNTRYILNLDALQNNSSQYDVY